jgi:hypothetical protein
MHFRPPRGLKATRRSNSAKPRRAPVKASVQPLEDAMDERQTLSVLGWVFGSVIGSVFLLNIISMP